jgi:hypothetical protein
MNYEAFRTLWHEALARAGLMTATIWPSETIDVRGMNRTYRISTSLERADTSDPFYVTVALSWRWDALLSARTATTEEALLMELLDEEGYDQGTERPWLRIDATLSATLPANAPLSMPDTAVWSRWIQTVTREMERLPPPDLREAREEGRDLLFWRGQPGARLECRPDGQLALAGVDMPAWLGIELPRQWDNPERAWHEKGAEKQLDRLVEWVRDALHVWNASLRQLVA